jgi:PAS domain S-box-containing protein/putative nucleotidyltransferase with HDIG domain
VSSIKNKSGQPIGFRGIIRDITERKQAEEELRKSEERFKLIFEYAPDAFYLNDLKGYFIEGNKAAERITGFKREELIGGSFLKLNMLSLDQLPKAVTLLAKNALGKPTGPDEFILKRKAGDKVLVEITTHPIKFEKRTVVLGIARDITERKRAEYLKKEREKELRILYGLSRIIEREGITLDEIYQELTNILPAGWQYPEIACARIVMGDSEFRTENFTESAWKQSAPVKVKGSVVGRIEVGYLEQKPKEDEGPFLKEEKGVIDACAERIGRLIESKRAEDGLRESEARFQRVINATMDGIWEWDMQTNREYFAPRWCEIIGYSFDDPELPHKFDSWTSRIHPDDRDRVLAALKSHLDSGTEYNVDYLHRHKSGEYRWQNSRGIRVLDENGKPIKMVGCITDITERKQAEEQIQRQVETLGALYDISRTLSESNDFNTILDLLTRRAVEAIHVTFARVLLLENGDLVARSIFPVRVLDQDLQVGQREPLAAHPTCQRVLEGNTPRVLQADSPEAGECAPFFLGIAQTLCIVPLHVREQPFGLLMFGEARAAAREPFTVEKLHLARSIGDQTASTLYRALLHEETERRFQRITALRTIDSTIAASMDLRITLSVLLEHVLTQLKVDAASVLLLNPHMQTLEYAAGRGFRTEALQRTHLRLGEGYAGRAALERKLIYIPDLCERKSDFLRSPYFLAEGFVAYYGVPLIAKGQVKGVLEVFHRAPLASGPDWVSFLETLAGQAAIAIDNTQLFDNLQRSTADLVVAYDATIEGWSAALDLRDKETEGHSLRVTEMTMQLARSLGIGEAELVHVRRGALLHDIGKMGVPDSILLKPDKLTDEEWVLMRKHTQLAFDMLAPITYLKPALDIPYCHHEKWDGTGYPRGLKGEQIPLSARIFAVVDVYDALTSDRPYRKAWPKAKVLEHLKAESGKHFDSQVLEAFLKMKDVADEQ